jgi:1-acyl-sn-glycerol-3-phosphate acyltransferase
MPDRRPAVKLRIRDYFISVAVWTYAIVTSLVASIAVIAGFVLIAPFDLRRRRLLTFIMRVWCRALMLNPLWRVRLEGLENIDPRETYVVAPTHQSYGDIFVLGVVPVHYVYLSKAEIFRIPFIGWAMYLVGCIVLHRGNKDSARAAMELSARKLRNGVSVLIFPEGTRSRDGTLGAFKEGAFRLAVQTGRPILPIAIEGSRYILPKGSFQFTQHANIRIAVLPPIRVDDKTEADAPALLAETRAVLEAKLDALRALNENAP